MRILSTVALAILLTTAAPAQWTPGNPAVWQPGSDACSTLLTPYWTPCPGRVPDSAIPFNWLPGHLVVGRTDANPVTPDFACLQEQRL